MVPLPPNEADRLAALHRYGVLDTPPDPRFDRIVALAAQLFDMPIALVSLVDAERQWFKARLGVDDRETSRDTAICAHVVASGAALEVPDVPRDARFADFPLVVGPPHIRFYAGAPLLDPDGHALGTLCVIDQKPRQLDMQQRQLLTDLAGMAMDALLLHRTLLEAEQARAEAEYANRAKSNFLAFMSHELRTPLNAVIGFGELMEAEPFGPLGAPRYKHYAGMIVEGGRHLLGVINAILDLTRIESGKFELRREALALDEEVDMAVRLVRVQAENRKVALACDAAALQALPEVQADRSALRQVLLNLIFTRPDGQVSITGRLEPGLDADWLRLSVSDTGIGIAPEDLRRLGEPFFQSGPVMARRAEGSGLGLAITRQLVALHGGRLEIESVLGQGTTVSVVLPLA